MFTQLRYDEEAMRQYVKELEVLKEYYQLREKQSKPSATLAVNTITIELYQAQQLVNRLKARLQPC